MTFHLGHQGPFRFTKSLATTATLVVALLLAGCSARTPGAPGVESDRAMIIFENESIAEVTLFATMPGHGRYRVGSVMPSRIDTLAAPVQINGRNDITFQAELLGRSERPSSPTVSLARGQWIRIRMSPSLNALNILAVP